MKKLLYFLTLFVASGLSHAGVLTELNTDTPTVNKLVEWKCSNSGYYDSTQFCVVDPDAAGSKAMQYFTPWTYATTKYTQAGIHEIYTGYANCYGSYCSVNASSDKIAIAPSSGWKINVSGPTSGLVGEPLTFTSTASSGKDCCTHRWSFGNGSTRSDKQLDGTSVQSVTYSQPGNYKVKVYLSDVSQYDGPKVESTHTVSITAAQSVPPSPISSIQYFTPRSGGVQTVPLHGTEQSSIWYSHDFDRYGNARKMSWSKPADAATEIEYKVDFGPAGRTANYTDINWSDYRFVPEYTSETWLAVLAGELYGMFYGTGLRMTRTGYSSTSNEYMKLHFRFRTVRDGLYSEWQYTKPIWVYHGD